MKHWKRVLTLALAAALFTLAACSSPKDNASSPEAGSSSKDGGVSAADAGSSAESKQSAALFGSFTAFDLEGNEVNQDILKDYDLTMVNVWATFCGPCLREMPELGQIHEEYKDKGVQVVGIVIDVFNQDGTVSTSQISTAQEIIAKTQANYLHLLPSEDLINAKLKDVSAVPETFFLDKEGNLVGSSYLGAKDIDGWKKVIDQKLEEVKG